MNFLIKLFLSALAIIIGSYIIPGVSVENFWTALVVAAVMAFLNAIVKPILIVLTIPITIFTLGIFLIFINAILIMFADYIVGPDFEVTGILAAFLFSLIISFINSLLERFVNTGDKD